jgi:hypothetical protein
MLKLYVWMQMDKNDILRELKRLELQVSAVAHQHQNRTPQSIWFNALKFL